MTRSKNYVKAGVKLMSLPFTLQNPVSRLIDKENINDMIFLFLAVQDSSKSDLVTD